MTEPSLFVRGWLPPWGVETMRLLILAWFKLFTRLETYGRENLPASGGFILSANHLTHFDSPLIFTVLKGRKVTVFAADKYRPHPFFRRVLECFDVIWVHRGAIGPSTMRVAARVLRGGGILGLAPEGTRSRVTHALLEGKTGAAFLALTAGVPIVPIALGYPDRIVPSLKRLRRERVTITVGKPIQSPPLADGRRPDAQLLETYTTEIMCRLAAMLPPEYRGVYAEHPRLKELLRADGG